MVTSRNRFSDYRPFILWGSLLGLGLVAILVGMSVARGDTGRALALAAITGWPFALGLLAIVPNLGISARRALMLVAAIGGTLVGWPLVFNGAGFWFVAIALGYLWAWWGSCDASA
jgi:hypothetical protein